MTNATLNHYFNVLFTMKNEGIITEIQMKQYANVIVNLIECGFTEADSEVIFGEINKEIVFLQ